MPLYFINMTLRNMCILFHWLCAWWGGGFKCETVLY